MCGIAGIIGNENKQDAHNLIKTMCDQMQHRGPDAFGHFTQPNVALGHRRLSIIDLSDSANQPLFDSSGRYVIVFNGEIYNFKEVKALLPNTIFKTSGDTEVILEAYKKWGKDCLHHLNGMFAFAIWDTVEQFLFVARDRLGIKPFYYYLNNNKLFFASELRALLSTNLIPRKASYNAIVDFLSFQAVAAPNTIIEGIKQLLPGQYATFKDGHFDIQFYWQLGTPRHYEGLDNYDTIKSNVLSLLKAAVKRQLVSDVPLGVFLSGGIDSTALVALVSEVSDQPVDTFSIVFDEQEFNESESARFVAKKFNTRHHEILVKSSDFVKKIPHVLDSMDSLNMDGANVSLISEVTREKGIIVALSGLGGDEIFAGYHYFKFWDKIFKYRKIWANMGFLRHIATPLIKRGVSPSSQYKFQKLMGNKYLTINNAYPPLKNVFSSELNDLLSIPTDNVCLNPLLTANSTHIEKFPSLSQFSIAELSEYTANVLLNCTDQMTMAHSLEVRVPFLDHELIEYVLQVPDKYKYPNTPKQLLVESLGLDTRIPRDIAFKKKTGFTLPFEHWMKTELRDFAEERIKGLSKRAFMNEHAVLKYWDCYIKGDTSISWVRILCLVTLEHWLKKNGVED